MGERRNLLLALLAINVLFLGSLFEENIFSTIEAQVSSTLKITKLTTGGDDIFDFTVTGPTSYNPSINTAEDGTSTITKLIIDTFPQNIDGATSDCVTCDVGQSGIMVQEITLYDEKISELIVRHLDHQFNTAGKVTAKIWSGITDGGFFEDAVVVDSSDVYDFSTETRHSTGGNLYQVFNFTTPVALTGTYFVGIEWENVDDDIQIDDMTTNGGGGFVGANPYRLDDEQTATGCLVAEGTIGATFSECSNVFGDQPELMGIDLAVQRDVPDVTVSSGIQTSNLKGYYTFDSSEVVDSSILLNVGTLGHLADGNFLKDNDANDNLDVDIFDCGSVPPIGDFYECSIANDATTVGILGESIEIQSSGGGGASHELMRFGTTTNEFDWSFLTSSSSNEVTMSFWLKADQTNFNEPLPVLSSNGISMILGINNTNPYIIIHSPDEPEPYVHQFTTLTVDGDSNFHNVVYRIDKTGSPDTVTVCVDGTSNCEGDGITGFDFPEEGEPIPEIGGEDRSKSLTIGEKAHNLESSTSDFDFDTDTEFEIDDMCIWDIYIDDTDIDTIYNNGNGNPCATVTPGGGTGGMGMDGPTPVDAGTYSVQETIPAGWDLTTASCNDGSSSFSVDTVSGIVIDPGDNIECTFENTFGVSTDTDGDGILDNIDTAPNTSSDDFSDISLGGTSSGTITTRGNQILTITEEPNPDGVRIDADISGGITPATVSVCAGASTIDLSPGDEIIVTCGSVTIDVTSGSVDVTFTSSGGTPATASLTAGNSITFDPDTFSFVVPATNTQTIIIDVQGTIITLAPGATTSFGFLKITKVTIGGDGTFDFTVTGPTSYNPSITTVGGTSTDGPTLVDPGTYSVQESVPAGWNLDTAVCSDGSSISIDTVSGIVINPGDNIECTFVNQLMTSPDSDGDGIFDDVDTDPININDDFSDIGIGGTSEGEIITAGDQILTITEEPNPDGVRIDADISGGVTPATVSVCAGASTIDLSPGDEIIVTCGSVIVKTISGGVEVILIASDGTQASTSIPSGNEITFDPQTSTITANPENLHTIEIMIGDTLIQISPGSSDFTDADSPQIIINSLINDEDSFIFGNIPPEPTCTAQDDLSGVDGDCSVIGYQTSVGTHQIQFTASDIAGNTNTITIDYQILPWSITGFYPPVDMGDVLNRVKGGSTIPLKFEVFQGTTDLTETSIAQLIQQNVQCDTSMAIDEIEIIVIGNTELSYHGGQFHFNWKTPKLPNTCWDIILETTDESSIVAHFKLK